MSNNHYTTDLKFLTLVTTAEKHPVLIMEPGSVFVSPVSLVLKTNYKATRQPPRCVSICPASNLILLRSKFPFYTLHGHQLQILKVNNVSITGHCIAETM